MFDPNQRSIGDFDLKKVSSVNPEGLQNIRKVDFFEGTTKLIKIDDSKYIGVNFESSPFSLICSVQKK